MSAIISISLKPHVSKNSKSDRQVILEFLSKNVLATISTVDSRTLQPESALIAFCELDTLEIIFITRIDSRKYNNLSKNNKVALVIGWEFNAEKWETLQYEGESNLVIGREYMKYRRIFAMKEGTPCSEEFLSNPSMKLFKVIPTWIGYSDFRGKEPKVIEIHI